MRILFSVLLFCLLVGCGGNDEAKRDDNGFGTITTVNSDLSERVKEFRNYYEKEKKKLRDDKFERINAPWDSQLNITFKRNLTFRNGIYYKVNSEIPFTGWRYELQNSQMLNENFFQKGKEKIFIEYDPYGRGFITGEGNDWQISKVYYEVLWNDVTGRKPTRMWEHFGYGGKRLLTIGYNEKGLPKEYIWKTSSKELPSLKNEE